MNNDTTIKFLYPDEKKRLFQVIYEDTSKYHIRNKAIFYIAEYAGLRASEIGLIKLTDVNMEKKEIYFKRLKGSNNNTLRILDSTVYSSLLEYLQYRENNGIKSIYLFVSQKGNPISRKTLDTIMKNYCRSAHIPNDKAHMHTLKHTRAIDMAELGLDTKEVQYWIGHKSIKNTEVYLQFTSKQQETLYRKIAILTEQI